MAADYRDLLLADLGARAAALDADLVDVTRDRDAYRQVAQAAMDLLHDRLGKYEHLRGQHEALTDEYRTFRERVMERSIPS